MAEVAETPAKPAHQAEVTFKNYNSEDAAKYAKHRPSYAPVLIELVINTHTSSGGKLDRVLDIGCGPGIATRQIASHFKHVTGIDASPSMIDKARQTECLSATGEQAIFEVCSSEDIDQHFEPNSIDLITAATAAHWFDMPRFYTAAAKVLKPSGSIAMWCNGRWFADPKTTPNLEAVQKVWDHLEYDIIRPFDHPNNAKPQTLYETLDLPWTIDASTQPPEIATALSQFDKSTFLRREFNKDGTPDPHPYFAATGGFQRYFDTSLDALAQVLGTSSTITRWRQAHKEQLEKGEVEDCIEQMLRATREEFAKVPEGVGREWVKVGVAAVLLVVKKKGMQ